MDSEITGRLGLSSRTSNTRVSAARIPRRFGLLALLVLLVVPGVLQAQWTYTTNSGKITITGYTGYGSAVTIPSTIFGWPVTAIGNNAFAFCSTVTSVSIPASVTTIGNNAFQDCTSLTSISITPNITSIGTYAFLHCFSLTAITVDTGNSVYSSVDGVLFNKNQTTLIQCPAAKPGNAYTIPGSVTSIGPSAFHSCTGLTTVTIPSSVTSLGGYVFQDCARLASVTIPSTTTSIGVYAFYGCNSLAEIMVDTGNSFYTSEDGVLFNKNRTTLVQHPPAKAGSGYTIPSSVTTIGVGAFDYCTNLTSITIPNSVTKIDVLAFQDCQSLASITIPNSVTSLGNNVFRDCFSLTSATLPSSMTYLEVSTFYDCISLRSVVIPTNVTAIGGWAFYNCSSLTSILIPNNVTSIGDYAFAYCYNLSKATIGNRVTSIGRFAFYYCDSLRGVYFKGSLPNFNDGSYVFYGDWDAVLYYLPGSTGWNQWVGFPPAAPWSPEVQAVDTSFGVRTNRFGFTIDWASGRAVVVEACENLLNPAWYPLQTNTLIGDSLYFSDPQWTNYPARLYRLRSP